MKALPDQLAGEVLDFAGFLRERQDRAEWRDRMEAQSREHWHRYRTTAKTKCGTMFERGRVAHGELVR